MYKSYSLVLLAITVCGTFCLDTIINIKDLDEKSLKIIDFITKDCDSLDCIAKECDLLLNKNAVICIQIADNYYYNHHTIDINTSTTKDGLVAISKFKNLNKSHDINNTLKVIPISKLKSVNGTLNSNETTSKSNANFLIPSYDNPIFTALHYIGYSLTAIACTVKVFLCIKFRSLINSKLCCNSCSCCRKNKKSHPDVEYNVEAMESLYTTV